MALDATKWQVRTDKSIRYIGGAHATAGANYVTVLELHRWLADLADDASVSNDDYMDITTVSPSDKKFDTIITLTNGYTLDDGYTTPASEFVYGGSIIQGTGGTEAIYDGIRVVSNRGTIVSVIQNNAVLTNKFWNNIPNGESLAGINFDAANGVCMQFMVLVRTAGADIDNKSLRFTTREWGKSFSGFRIPATGRGQNVVPLQFTDDLNNATASGTVATWTTIANVTAGFNLIDVNQDTTDEQYYSEWNRDTYSINDFYERMKYISRNGETATLYDIPGELFRGITHSVAYTGLAGGAFVEGGATPVSWGTGATAGTGQILADDASGTIIYIQLLTGVVPNANTLTQGGVTATASTVVERAVSAPFCGQSTGSSLVGAYGFSLEYADLAVNDKIQALDGTTRQPPNNVTFTVAGIQSGWRILVGPEDGAGALDFDQLTLNGTLTGAAVTAVIVTEAIPANTPTSGTIRILRDDGSYTRHPYSAVNTGSKTFTITSHDFSTNNATTANNVFISYIDADSAGTSIQFNTVQSSVQTLFIEARYGGTGPNFTDSIKPAKTTSTLNSTGGTSTISAVSDA
ncbi:MAG: hypothetical protein OEY28_07900 [Nitrospira sp.]|nr:hypothetical protein [Nitrospira sp.]